MVVQWWKGPITLAFKDLHIGSKLGETPKVPVTARKGLSDVILGHHQRLKSTHLVAGAIGS